MKLPLPALPAVAFLLATAVPAQPGIPLAFHDSVPAWLASAHVPGLAVAVLENGMVTSIRTFGELRPGIPLTPRALFNVASLTKPVTAVTALRLASADKLSLDAPLDPDWIDPDIRDDPRHSKLTARIVLSHQTGFPTWRHMLPSKKLVFTFDPGTKFGYSGEGYEYLRVALGNHLHTTLPHLADSIIFEPLGMKETTFGWNPAMDTLRFAIGHDTVGAIINGGVRTTDHPSAADWLVTTISDYSKFAQLVLDGAGLSPTLYAEMIKPQVQLSGKPGEAMGLGWEVMKGPPEDPILLLHTGSDDGIKTMILLLPKSKRGLVIFSNGERGMDVIVKILHEALHLKELDRS
ncbi:MAG: beta-lactamase family protein [Gemmatimonadaceae bacterium]|nr:beta-lactamase family protein [Gemmatimonadaceae bacterium]